MITTSGRRGFTLTEIMIVVAVIGLIAAIAVPNFVKARQKAQAEACVANLKQIEGAIQMWAVDTGSADTATPQWDNIVPDYIRTQPSCAAGGNYALAPANSRPTCSLGNTVTPEHVLP